MNISDYTSKYLLVPHSLKLLAGADLDSLDLNEQFDKDEMFDEVPDSATTIEIVTLEQHRYELAFDYVLDSMGEGVEDDSEEYYETIHKKIEKIIPKFVYIKPHIQVNIIDILIVMDCVKIDHEQLEIATKLLRKLPSTEPGFYWDYNITGEN